MPFHRADLFVVDATPGEEKARPRHYARPCVRDQGIGRHAGIFLTHGPLQKLHRLSSWGKIGDSKRVVLQDLAGLLFLIMIKCDGTDEGHCWSWRKMLS